MAKKKTTKNRQPRFRKYSPELVKEICEWIAKGTTNQDVCAVVGIDKTTYYDWLREENTDGTKNRAYKPHLSHSIKKAYALRKTTLINRIMSASKVSWQAAAWYLERTEPDQFGPKGKLEITDAEDTIKKVLDLINKREDGKIQPDKPNILSGPGGKSIQAD